MTLNLVQHRSGPSVWDRPPHATDLDLERWLAVSTAGVLLVTGLKRAPAGVLLATAGFALVWWAAMPRGERQVRRARLGAMFPRRRAPETDVVTEAAEESFPASDAPAWTSTVGRTGSIDREPVS